jgi:NitT/TauT family transport system ATP-binding protein
VLGANPGHIRAEISGLPLAQRSILNDAHTKLVDVIYRIMTSPQEDISKLLPSQSTQSGQLPHPHAYQVLPHEAIGDITGLIELVYARGGREDLYQIGRHFQLEVDDLFPLIEAVDLLDFAETQEGDLVLTEAGKRFAEADVQEEKKIFREQALANIRILRRIVDELEKTPSHILPEEHILQILQDHFGEQEAEAQLETAINWGRYAELFSYQDDRGIFRLEEPDTVTP